MRPIHDIVRDEVRGDATADEVAWLNEHPEAWRDALIAVIEDVDVQFSARKATAEAFQSECLARPDGQADWFAHKAEYEEWRGRTNGFKRHITRRLREVKQLIHERHPASAHPRGRFHDALIEIRDLLDLDEDCVCDRIADVIDGLALAQREQVAS